MATPELVSVEEQEAELVACAASSHYFLSRHGRIYDPDRRDWIPFALWPAQEAVLSQVRGEQLSVILKARQLGLTWLCLGYGLWEMVFRPPARFLCFSRRETDAAYLLGPERLRGMLERLPGWLLPAMGAVPTNDAAHSLYLSNGSTAHAFPCNAGDSYTATFALLDEFDLLTDQEQARLLGAVKPTIEHGGKMVLLSRSDKSRPESPFKRLYREAKEGRSAWRPAFLPWHVRPDRDAAWHKAQEEHSKAFGSLDWLHEHYPSTDAEALAPRTLDKRLRAEWLTRCYREAPPLPGPFPPYQRPPAIPGLTVYAPPVPGRRYAVGADPAEGNPTSDPSALVVVDVDRGEEVASLAGRFEPATFASYIDAVGRYYNNAPVLVERNNHGHAVLLWLRDHSGLTLLCDHDGKAGWNTTTKSKAGLYAQAGEALRDGDAVIHGLDTFSQLASIDGSTLRAPEGEHDDRAVAFVLALVGCGQLLRQSLVDDGGAMPSILVPGQGNVFGPDYGAVWRPAGRTGGLGYGAEGPGWEW
jgi:hypothetical protein